MSIRISPVLSARMQTVGLHDCVLSLEVPMLGGIPSPVAWLEHLRVTGSTTGPRLAEGVSAATYVLPDSDASVRVRDSLGHDTAMRPGGLLWMQAGSGIAHEHLPAERGKLLHCLHLGISRQAAAARAEPEPVPEWRSNLGDNVRVVAGAYGGLVSPAAQEHAFSLLDVRLRSTAYFDVREGHHTLVYVLSGGVLAITDVHVLRLEPAQAFVIHKEYGNSLLQLVGSGQLLIIDTVSCARRLRMTDRLSTRETVDA